MKDSEITQFKNVYESTIEFEKYLKKFNFLNNNTKNILDLGTGLGANLQYFFKKNKHINFTGSDYRSRRINIANKLNKNPKIKFQISNILNFNSLKKFKKKFDGIISIHTICCFKNLNKPISNILKLKAKWIAINSLFFDGDLDVLIHIRDHKNKKLKVDNPDSDFNIFSIRNLKKIVKKHNYEVVKVQQFFPKNKIKRKSKGARGSYTLSTELNKNTTFSGPVFLPWYFIIIKKKNVR